MNFLAWLQELGRTADPTSKGFEARPLYLLMSVLMPVTIGLAVGLGVRLIERILGIERARRGGH